MRKVSWTVLGIVGASLLLCGSGELLAQVDTAARPADTVERDATDTRVQGTPLGSARVGAQGTGTSPTATQSPGTTGSPGITAAPGTGGTAGETDASSLELRRTVLQLQADLGRMSQELAQVRAELANLSASMGVGGSGQAGTQADAQDTATGGSGTQGTAAANRGTAARGTQDPGEAVVNAIYTGTVNSVSTSQLVLLDEEGQAFTVELGERTRVLRDGERITARQLKKGTRVRATVDLLAGHNKATEIVTLPAAR
jgi:hypothetical protein